VAREDELGRGAVERRRLPPRPALVARAIDLHDRLGRREVSGCGDLLEQRLDVGAQEFRRAVTRRADEVEVARVAVRRLEARAPFPEVDLPGDAGVDHPLERAIDGRASDPRVLAVDALDELVGAEVTFLLEKDGENPIPLGRALSARRTERGKIR